MKTNNNHNILFLLVIFALLLRIGIFVISKPWDINVVNNFILAPQTDDIGYHNIAVDLLKTRSFDTIGYIRTPGYPIFMAFFYFLFGINPYIILIAQIFLWLGSLILVYFSGKLFFNKTVGALASIFYMFDPYAISFSTRLLSDTLFTFIFLLSIFILSLGLKSEKYKYFIYSGIILGFATLVKPIAQFFPIFLIFLKTQKKNLLIFFLFFIICISPWLVRNYINYNTISLTSIAKSNLINCNIAATERNKNKISIDEAKKNVQNYNIKNYILSNWNYYLLDHFRGAIKLFLHTSTKDYYKTITEVTKKMLVPPRMTNSFIKSFYIAALILIHIYLLITYTFFFIGLFFSIKEKMYNYLMILIPILLYFINITGHVGYSRYKLPIIPFYLILSAYGAYGAYKCLKKYKIF